MPNTIIAGTEVVLLQHFDGLNGRLQVGAVGIAITDLIESSPGVFDGAVRYPRSGVGHATDPDLLVGAHHLRVAQEGERIRLPDGYFYDQIGRVRSVHNHLRRE